MRRSNVQMLLTLLAVVASGCTTTGIGSGSTLSGEHPTVFNWKSSDGISGTMNATMSGGKTFSGRYIQVAKDTTVDSIGPLWYSGWGGRIGWSGWDYRGAYPSPDFTTHYTGRLVAQLAAPNGTHMRCRFRLVHPADGMNGGGIGQCQSPDGTTIDANFPTA